MKEIEKEDEEERWGEKEKDGQMKQKDNERENK